MIKDITELRPGFPANATLSSATVSLQDMGEKSITSQVKIDGSITPDFSKDWEVEFRGEKYIMPLRKPQASKENSSLNSVAELTFQHWAQYQLKRYYFFTVQSTDSDTYIPDQYVASVSLDLQNFRTLFNRVLAYYFGDEIQIELDPEWEAKGPSDPVVIEINYSYLWDVLIQLYDLYGVRWKIECKKGVAANLLLGTDWVNPKSTVTYYEIEDGSKEVVAGDKYTLSFDYQYAGVSTGEDLDTRLLRLQLAMTNQFGFIRYFFCDVALEAGASDLSGSGKAVAKISIPEGVTSLHRAGLANMTASGLVSLSNAKLERGWNDNPQWALAESEGGGEKDVYIIKLGQTEQELDHIFEYGFEGGLLKVERQVQDDNIRNKLMGRGGSTNIPLRYFKDVDPNNSSFPADPDWIPELRNVSFTSLRSKEFRDYVQGWKTNPRRQLTESNGTPIKPYGSNTAIKVEPYSKLQGEENWAYRKGHFDEKFDPVEFVKDDESIALYGELPGALDDNEDIYPSIQGRVRPGLGRVDEVVAVEQVEDTVIVNTAVNDAMTLNVAPDKTEPTTRTVSAAYVASHPTEWQEVKMPGGTFMIPDGKVGNFSVEEVGVSVEQVYKVATNAVRVKLSEAVYEYTFATEVVNSMGKKMDSQVGLPAGVYTYSVVVKVRMKAYEGIGDYVFTVGHNGGVLDYATPEAAADGRTFKIWIKNIWENVKGASESASEYVDRVWGPILGDGEGNEAKVIFSDGWLATSEDYEFRIVKGGITFDENQFISVVDDDGSKHIVRSHWCLTLERSDADLESTGLYVPNAMRQGKSGDHFFFTGIELPHFYVVWAEDALQNYKLAELAKVKDIAPTWVVTFDRIRLNELGEDGSKLIDKLIPGAPVRLADKRFILNEQGTPAAYETLYVQSVTITYREPSSSDAALNPDVEVVLSDSYATAASPVAEIQGSIEALSRQVASIGNIEQLIRAVADKIYLRKDGLFDLSVSPTEFANLLTSYGFRQGMIGGHGWGFYRDANGAWVLEIDRLKARQDFEVNNLVVNQISARGGMIVESAASIEVSAVEELADGSFRCYFDQKGGSVMNLFKVDDIALCHRFNPGREATPGIPGDRTDPYEKYYKRTVKEVAADSIVLDNSYYRGDGVPEVGDVIVHYGSAIDANRQFVIVRDVTGGGYERFIDGLDSVDSDGTEYYFVGKQAGMYGNKARFFLGDLESYIEYIYDAALKKHRLKIKAELSVESTIEGKSVKEYIEEVAGDDSENYALGTGMEMVYHPSQNMANETKTLYKITGLALGDTVKVSFDYVIKDAFTGAANQGIWVILGREYGYKNLLTIRGGANNPDPVHYESEAFVLGEGAYPDYIEGTTPETESEIYLRTDYMSTGEIIISNLMIVKGDKMSAWRPSPNDFNFMAKALGANTTISGGLVLTSAVEVGNWDGSGYTVRAGVSGIDNSQHAHGGVVFWGGGTYEQANNGKSTYVIYMDGTGHAAGGTIKFQENNLQVGDYVNLNKQGLDMIVDGGQKMRMGNYDVKSKSTFIMDYQITKDLGNLRFYAVAGGNPVIDYQRYDDGGVGFRLRSPARLIEIKYGAIPAGATLSINPIKLHLADFGEPAPSGMTGQRVGLRFQMEFTYANGMTTDVSHDVEPSLTGSSVDFDLSKVGAWPVNSDVVSASMTISLYNTASIELSNPVPNPSITEVSTINGNAYSTISLPQDNITELGSNGLRASWGSANQYQTDNFWGVRVLNSGIEVIPNGLRVMVNGVWKEVDLAKIIKA